MTTPRKLSAIVGVDLGLPHEPPEGAQSAHTGHEGQAETRHEHIALAAHFIAQSRGFATGEDLDDWLCAERQIAQEHGA